MDDQILDPSSRAELPEEMTQGSAPGNNNPWYKNVKVIISAVVALILVCAIGWYFLLGRTSSTTPTSNKVTLLIKGPSTLSSGTEAEFDVLYHNGEDADMTNVHLDLIYPSNFQFKSATPASKTTQGQSFDLPIVKAGADAKLVIRGKLSGATNEDKQILGKLFYVLSNFNSTFEVDQTFHTTIQAPNLTFDVSGPIEVPIGQDTTFTLNYSNVSQSDYDNVALTVAYPDSFRFTSASTLPSKNNNYWSIGKLAKGASGHIDITGSFEGQNLDEQLLAGQLGQVISGNFASQITSTATFKLKGAPIGIRQEVTPADVVKLGDNVEFTIHYSNDSNIGLTNLVITDTLNSSLIDTSRLNVPDGVITGSTITWKAATNSNLSLLSPGQSGQVQFNLPIKQSLPVTAKNQIIASSVSVTSAQITTPIRAQDVQLKLASKLTFDVVGDFVSGAIPMQVGNSSTFAITFVLSNLSNDLNSTEVVASMPLPASAWNGVIIPDAEKSRLSFDPTSGLIRWEVGTLPAFTGKNTPAAKVTFQLVVTPSASDQGQTMRLLSNVSADAFDSFTNQKLTPNSITQFTTSDVDDAAFQSAGTTVE